MMLRLISVFIGLLFCSQIQAAKLIFTSNTPELYARENGYSLAKMATFVDRLKQGDQSTVFVHGGGSFSPSPLSVYDQGAHMVSVLNAMSVDAMAVNAREFNYGIDQVTLLSKSAQYPLVLSNLFDLRTDAFVDGVQPYILLPVGEITLGILMAVSSEVNSAFLFDRAKVDVSEAWMAQMVQEVRQKGADWIILIVDRRYLSNLSENRVDGVDMVVIAREGKDEILSQQPLVVASGGMDDEMLVLDISNDTLTPQIVHTANEEPSPELTKVIARYTNQLDIVLDQKLTRLAAPMNSKREIMRRRESRWGDIVLDAMQAYTQADFAMLNGGSIRGQRQYKAGHILTRRDVQREMPFGGSVFVIEATAEVIKAALEHGVSNVEQLDGRFMQVAGLRYTYDSSLPKGQRIQSITDAQGLPLRPEKTYRLALSDYLLNGGDGYDFSEARVVSDHSSNQRLIWNIVSDYLSGFDEISPRLEGRISDVHSVVKVVH